MNAPAFKVRSPERDKKNDDARIQRLDDLLDNVIAEVRRERNGLRARYLASADNSVRPLDMMTSQMLSDLTDENVEALKACVLRLKRLDAQESVLSQMQQDIVQLQGLND